MNEVIDSHSDCRRLVILIHGLGQDVSRLSAMKVVVAETWPNAAIFAPQLPLAVLSMQDPNEIVADLLKKIDEEIDNAAGRGVAYDDVVLIGHSVGSILARKLYVVACGEIERYPLEKIYRKAFGTAEHELIRARDWAGKVSRIVLMAGMNRGWSISNHFGFLKLCAYLTGTLVGNILSMLLRKRPLAFTVRRGAEFITQLRIHWIVMRKNACSTEQGSTKLAGRAGNALTIQLLGSRDDLVSPDDNIDLASGGDFVYLDVPNSGHADVINLGSGSHRSIVEDARRDCFLKALTLSAKELEHESIIPSDDKISRPDDNILSVVFVIHGIRDVGYWTQKIARQIRKRANAHAAEWATETSSYGYFPMLHFFLPWMRRKKVEWLMDQYAEAIARYPNASFSYVGHSHGTYLVARALELYPCCRFKRIVFAGSVVRRNYNWTALVTGADPRVGSVLNFVASKD